MLGWAGEMIDTRSGVGGVEPWAVGLALPPAPSGK